MRLRSLTATLAATVLVALLGAGAPAAGAAPEATGREQRIARAHRTLRERRIAHAIRQKERELRRVEASIARIEGERRTKISGKERLEVAARRRAENADASAHGTATAEALNDRVEVLAGQIREVEASLTAPTPRKEHARRLSEEIERLKAELASFGAPAVA